MHGDEDDRITRRMHVAQGTVGGAASTEVPPRNDAETGSARLVVIDGPCAGRHWALSPYTRLGRGSQADVLVDDSLVSREHAAIELDERGWAIRDLGSRNGTFVNGRRIDATTPLRFGDRISVGRTHLLFAHVDPAHERLIERQRIEALGRLAAGVAHDLNNYFAAILGALDYLQDLPGDCRLSEREVRECLADARAATARGAELTQRLRAFGRRTGERPTDVDVRQLLCDVVEIARRTFDRTVRIDLSAPEGLFVRGDPGRLHQVLMNLLVNARDAMPDGGLVSVRAELLPPTETRGPRVVILLCDTGVGMDEQTRARIFEPFFTTKPADRGTGLGLSIVLDVVSAHGGTVECDSEPGRGTRFRIELPASEAPAGARAERRTPYNLRRTGELVPAAPSTVLVIDDDALVRRSIRRLLSRDEMTVEEVGSGAQAVDRLARRPHGIGAVLLDLDMPGMDGETACRKIHEQDPTLPIIILSGLCDDARRVRLEEAGAHAVLQKPCDAATLRSTLATALDARVRAAQTR